MMMTILLISEMLRSQRPALAGAPGTGAIGDITAYSTLALAILTFVVLCFNVYYVWYFKKSVDVQWKSAQGDMLLQLARDFFYREPHKRIIRLTEEGHVIRDGTGRVTDEDLDDHIGFLDTVGTLVREKILSKRLAWSVFSHYVESTHDCPELAEYIRVQSETDPSLFEDFLWLYKEMKKFGPKGSQGG